MTPRRTTPTVPREAIPVTTYGLLDRYLGKFSSGELGLVLLLGRPGTGKSESVKRALSVPEITADDAGTPGGSRCATTARGRSSGVPVSTTGGRVYSGC